MKLYTYFRAMEWARDRAIMTARNDPDWINVYRSAYNRYRNLRDGLIKRMERVEMKCANQETQNNMLRKWLAEAESEG